MSPTAAIVSAWPAFFLTVSSNLVIACGGIALWWLRDRRRDRSATQVAELTVDSSVASGQIAALAARFGLVNQTFDAERESMVRQNQTLTTEIGTLSDRLVQRDREIATLRDEVAALHRQVGQLAGQVLSLQTSTGPIPVQRPSTTP